MSASNSTTTASDPTTPLPSSISSSTPVSSLSTSTTADPSTTPTTSSSSAASTTPSATPSSTTTAASSSQTPSQTASTTAPTTTARSTTTTSSATPTPSTFAVTSTSVSTNAQGSTVTIIQTSTATGIATGTTSSGTASSSGAAATAGLQGSGSSSGSKGLSSGGTIAIAVVVPIVAVALLVLAGLFFWRKRKARKDAEELRRKEVEEYGYNPNNDPTLPAVGGSAGNDGSYEMREDGASGYRGWGTTAVASSGRKASTTLSGPSANGIGMAYSEGTSPNSPSQGPISDTRSENPLMNDGRPTSGGEESLGAMGPAAAANRTGDINRGPSNASSSYSAANRSDGSGEGNGGYYGGQSYGGQYDAGNPYGPEGQFGSPPGRAEMGGQPVIRDVSARRNTRIENPSHFPQQSAGISQNF